MWADTFISIKLNAKILEKKRGFVCQESMLFMYLEDVDKNNGSPDTDS